MALESPLVVVIDEAVDSDTCEKIITLSSRRAPQVIPVTDEAAGTRTQKRKFTIACSKIAEASEVADAERAALQSVSVLVETILRCEATELETVPNVHFTEPSAAAGLTLGLHVDTNMKPDRFATALLYLRDVPAGGGGETIFPLGGDSAQVPPAAASAQRLLDGGCTHTRRVPRPELEPAAAQLCAAALALAGAASASADGLAAVPSRGALIEPRAGLIALDCP